MRNPSISEVAVYLEVPEELVVDSLNSVMSVQSIEEPLANNGKEFTYEDTKLHAPNAAAPSIFCANLAVKVVESDTIRPITDTATIKNAAIPRLDLPL